MSGIVGIVNVDGAPVDGELLRRMTDFLAFRGPDAQEVWFDGSVGFGHTVLRSTIEAEREHQPCSLNGDVWITADARIDARPELKARLEAAGRRDVKHATDAELILHAYHAWGEECVAHLLGDFALAIWDGARRRLFCARDHFGVKPFYYARVGDSFVFGNTLNCVRRHPGLSNDLNELAVADFLLFGYNQESDTTTFSSIRALAPAHSLLVDRDGARTTRYWQLPVEPVRFRRPDEYAERFRELLDQAVSDRLRVQRAGILMSGGLDSPSIAAMAVRQLAGESGGPRLTAYTCVYDHLIPDEERQWAGLVAQHLRLPVEFVPVDHYRLYERWEQPGVQAPEPLDSPLRALSVDLLRRASADYRVILTGEAGDAVCYPAHTFPELVGTGRLAPLAHDIWSYWRGNGRRPAFGVRAWLKKVRGRKTPGLPYPPWLDDRFEARWDLRRRWEERGSVPDDAYQALTSPVWPWCVLAEDPGWTGLPIEARHPFLDLRLVTFMLGVPGVPWGCGKELVRTAMKGLLPDAVLRRPKMPLARDPVCELIRRDGRPQMRDDGGSLWRFVDRARFHSALRGGRGAGTWRVHEGSPVVSLGYWLEGEHRIELDPVQGAA